MACGLRHEQAIAYADTRHLPTTDVLAPPTVVAMHDPIYKRLFDSPRVVADLLRAVGRGSWLDDIDLGTLEKLPGERVGDHGQQRRGDAVWRARFRNGWLYLLIVLEFQSANDPHMALRNLEYTALLYQELARRGELGEPGQWPPVLPLVLYNGDAPWSAALEMQNLIAPVDSTLVPYQPSQRSLLLDERHVAVDDLPLQNLIRGVVGFEQSRTPAEISQVATALRGWLRTPQDSELSRAFAAWIRQMVGRLGPQGIGQELGETLEEATMTLVERVAQWPEQWRREGVAEGRREGVAEGRREGVARERALLRQLAAVRFGDAVGDRVGELLSDINDADQLAAVEEQIMGVDNGSVLIDRVANLQRRSH